MKIVSFLCLGHTVTDDGPGLERTKRRRTIHGGPTIRELLGVITVLNRTNMWHGTAAGFVHISTVYNGFVRIGTFRSLTV